MKAMCKELGNIAQGHADGDKINEKGTNTVNVDAYGLQRVCTLSYNRGLVIDTQGGDLTLRLLIRIYLPHDRGIRVLLHQIPTNPLCPRASLVNAT